ncbi:MAG: universal stress protein [Candidatus Bathyarchaeota archaeon]|nr:universal stress protein [Candidatus Bathyarchaeota archaeon]
MIKRVLVAVDGSENSNRALDFALDLAEKYNANVTVLNVSESPAMGVVSLEPTEPMAYAGGTVDFYKDFHRFHEDILRKAVNRAREFKPNVTVSSKLREGNAASEIVAEAKEGAFDIIVVGHKGLGRVKELFLGNISERVAHLAPCPVIIVR